MTADRWPDSDDLRQQLHAQLALEGRFPGWQVLHAMRERWVRYVRVPEGSFFAVHDRLSERPLFAADLEKLASLLEERQAQLVKAERWGALSALRSILADERRRP